MDARSAQAPTMPTAPIRLDASVLERAKGNDLEAIATMFRQFMSPDEEIYFAEYCGLLGFWIFGTHSFACLSNRRLASLQVGAFGRVFYNDGFLEHQNSGAVHQPSLLKLYLWSIFATVIGVLVIASFAVGSLSAYAVGGGGLLGVLLGVLTVAVGLGLGLLVVFSVVKLYYALNKCGLVWWIREGISVYIFTNRGKMSRANHLYRLSCQVRDERLKAVATN